MKNSNQRGLIGKVLLVLIAIIILFAIYSVSRPSSTEQNLLGGDRDEHGCIGSAGYSWSEEKQECVRPWEEVNEAASSTFNNNN